jgi:hypothetical protein
MLRSNLPISMLAILFAAGTFVAPKMAYADFACGVVDGKTLKNCQVIKTQTECTQKCEPVNMVKTCTTQCGTSCHTTATTACTAGCETDCVKVCTPDPTKYDCKTDCDTQCQGSCAGHCSTSIDTVSCSGHCKAECDTTCTEKCTPLPATETCANKCKTSCEGSCTVQSDTDCSVSCETDCTTQTKGACTTKCNTTEGALFCDDQFINPSIDLSKCVTEIESIGQKVAGWVTVSGSGNGAVTVSTGGCTAGGDASQRAGTGALACIAGAALLFGRRSRRQG